MPLIGIDLGTTFSAVAYLDSNGTPMTIPNADGDLTTPSVILIEKNGEVIVGREARRAALTEPGRTADYVKRSMGDPLYPRLVNGKRMNPVELSALILKKLKADAEKKVGKIEGAVITVPAYFDEARRHATATAGRIAGLHVIDIINEPTSAALAYAYKIMAADGAKSAGEIKKGLAVAPPQKVLVYDLGGGTFDVTILAINGGQLRVVATTGDVKLGGRDWDERLFNHAADAFVHAHGEDPRDNAISYQNLMLAAEEAKRILSQRKQTNIVVTHAGKVHSVEVSRDLFQQLTADLLYRTENRLTRVLKQASLTWDKVDQVLAVGGSTRMPQVLEMLKRVTGKDANVSLSPDEAVAHGAAIHAAVTMLGALPKAMPDAPAKPAPAASKSLPNVARLSQPSEVPRPREMPDFPDGSEVSAPGILCYFKNRALDLLRSIRTTNVNAHSLGVIVMSGASERVSVLIPHDTQLPVSVKKTFGTAADNQKTVTVKVVEGESKNAAECLLVGSCQIRALPDNLKKNSPIEVTFTYDNSARLHVEARELTSGSWATAVVQRKSGLPMSKVRASGRTKFERAAVS